MAPIPFLGRLNLAEYIALVGSFFLVGLEALIRIFTLALPPGVISLFYKASRRLFNRYASSATKLSEGKTKDISTSIRNACDFVDLCALFGYTTEEHIVQTQDGYLLGLHRLAWRKGEEHKVNAGENSVRKNVVYMHHGLLMNSEVWVCLTDEQRCLPFKLVEKGYDVWFGNNRGNKYSKKSMHHSPNDIPFWDFSMDEFALIDIPDSIHYILETTSAPSLSYIGFSQGTAQAFATLAVHPRLNDQVNVFIALAPAMSPAGLSNGIVDVLVKASPQVIFLLFGRRSILSSTTTWQSILYPPIFVRVIDMGLKFLFGWHARNIPASQKLAAYPHLYSFTSTKSVVHWFQIIRTKTFQMYDDDVQPPLSIGSVSKYTKVARFPTRNIKTPIVLVYGGSDSLVDIDVMLKELPGHTIAIEVPHFEHLDFLWAREVDTLVFPHVFDALESFCDAKHSNEEYETYRRAHHASLSAANAILPTLLPPSYMSEDDSGQALTGIAAVDNMTPREETRAEFGNITSNETSPKTNGSDPAVEKIDTRADISSSSRSIRQRVSKQNDHDDSSDSSHTDAPRTPTPGTSHRRIIALDGSSDVNVHSPLAKLRNRRSNSIGSNLSFGERGKRGISLGAGRAVSGVSVGIETVASMTMSSDEARKPGNKKKSKI